MYGYKPGWLCIFRSYMAIALQVFGKNVKHERKNAGAI